jgi:CheY-like chemotaxis protein
VVVDAQDGRVVQHNPAAGRWYGRADGTLGSLHWKDLSSTHDGEPRRGWQLHLDARGRPLGAVVETHAVVMDGRAAVLCFLVPSTAADPSEGERARARENVALMAGGMAHDLNNQLSVLAAHGSLLQAGVMDANARESTTAINGATQRVSEQVRLLLSCASHPGPLLRAWDLPALLKGACVDIHRNLPPDTSLLTTFPDAALPAVLVDVPLFTLLLHNLVDHALACRAPGSSALLELRVESRVVDRAALDAITGGNRLAAGTCVAVELLCRGAVDAESPVVLAGGFSPTSPHARCLRLAGSHAITRLHRACLAVENHPVQGLTMTALFPPASAAAEAAPPPAPNAAAMAPITILVADDEESVRSVVTRILERGGHRVLTAADGNEAMVVFRQHSAEMGAVLLDVSMPRQGGDELVSQIRALNPRVRIILMSGFNEEEATGHAAGMPDAFIRKPFLPDELRARLKAVLQGS